MALNLELIKKCAENGFLNCLSSLQECTKDQSSCYYCTSNGDCSTGCCSSNLCANSDKCQSKISSSDSTHIQVKSIVIIVFSIFVFLFITCSVIRYLTLRRRAQRQLFLQMQNDQRKAAVIEAQNIKMNQELNNMMLLQNMNQIQQGKQLWNPEIVHQQQQFGFYQPQVNNNQDTNLYPPEVAYPQMNNQITYLYPSQIAQAELVPYEFEQNPQGIVTIQQKQPQQLTNNGLVTYL